MLFCVASSASIGKELDNALADRWKPLGAVCPEPSAFPIACSQDFHLGIIRMRGPFSHLCFTEISSYSIYLLLTQKMYTDSHSNSADAF